MGFNTAKKHPAKSQELLAYHSTILVEALCFSLDELYTIEYYESTSRKNRVVTSSLDVLLTQPVPWQLWNPSRRSRPAENAQQPGLARKRFRRDPAPQPGTSSSGTSAAKSIAFPSTKGSVSGTRSHVTESTSAFAVVEWWIARPSLFRAPSLFQEVA